MKIYEEIPNITRAEKEDNSALVQIGDKKYLYSPISLSLDDLIYKFNGIWKHSLGRALAWMKKNATAKRLEKRGDA